MLLNQVDWTMTGLCLQSDSCQLNPWRNFGFKIAFVAAEHDHGLWTERTCRFDCGCLHTCALLFERLNHWLHSVAVSVETSKRGWCWLFCGDQFVFFGICDFSAAGETQTCRCFCQSWFGHVMIVNRCDGPWILVSCRIGKLCPALLACLWVCKEYETLPIRMESVVCHILDALLEDEPFFDWDNILRMCIWLYVGLLYLRTLAWLHLGIFSFFGATARGWSVPLWLKAYRLKTARIFSLMGDWKGLE